MYSTSIQSWKFYSYHWYVTRGKILYPRASINTWIHYVEAYQLTNGIAPSTKHHMPGPVATNMNGRIAPKSIRGGHNCRRDVTLKPIVIWIRRGTGGVLLFRVFPADIYLQLVWSHSHLIFQRLGNNNTQMFKK